MVLSIWVLWVGFSLLLQLNHGLMNRPSGSRFYMLFGNTRPQHNIKGMCPQWNTTSWGTCPFIGVHVLPGYGTWGQRTKTLKMLSHITRRTQSKTQREIDSQIPPVLGYFRLQKISRSLRFDFFQTDNTSSRQAEWWNEYRIVSPVIHTHDMYHPEVDRRLSSRLPGCCANWDLSGLI